MKYTSFGTLNSKYENGITRIVLEVDLEIVNFARALVPKYYKLNRQKYSPHISVVRESFPIKNISQFSGETVMFTYDFDIVCGDVYWWLYAESARLRELRLELGLPELDWYNRPPDNKDCFHITIGNQKI